MQLKVFALLLTIIYVVSCESDINTEVENEAQTEQRSQEVNKISEEQINEQPIMTSSRTGEGSQKANERTQVILAINPKPNPAVQVVEVQEHRPPQKVVVAQPIPQKVIVTQNHNHNHRPQPVKEVIVAQPPQQVIVSHHRPQPVKEVIVAQPPQQVIVSHHRPQPVKEVIVAQPPQQVIPHHHRPQHEVIVAQPPHHHRPQHEVIVAQPPHHHRPQHEVIVAQPPHHHRPQHEVIVAQPAQHPIPEKHVPVHPPRCVFLNSEGTCATIPSFFTCIRDGGILAPDLVRCSWIQACCIRNFLG